MTLAEYQTLTGITVASSQQAKVTAQITRTRLVLETMLGFTLDKTKAVENLYNELGKSNESCFCPSVDLENLEEPDDVEGSYRLFHYDKRDQYFFVDPFTTVYSTKLVYIKQGTGDNGVTIKTFDDENIRLQFGRDNWGKYIEHCHDCLCECNCENCVMLAVDADWLNEDCIPTDLKYVWADMVTFYSDDSKQNIKSESIDTHSYTRFEKKAPESESHNLAVIKRYAGPYGSVSVMPV